MKGWVWSVVILAAGLDTIGAAIAAVDPAALLPAGEQMTGAAHVYAGYLVSRDLALAVGLCVFLILGARQVLTAVLLMSALTQLLDIAVDSASGRAVLVPGLGVLCGLLIVAAIRTSCGPVWRRSTWLDVGSTAPGNSSALHGPKSPA